MTELSQILKKTNQSFALSSAQVNSLKKLDRADTLYVIGGQQVHLFGGPAMVLYKACSLIAKAKQVEKEKNIPCVPIFWLQNEDHDLAEVNYLDLPTASGLKRLAMPGPEENRISLNWITLDKEVEQIISDLEKELANFDHSTEIIDLIKKHYKIGSSYSQAFAGFVLELFAEQGLLVFDPSAEGVKKLTSELYLKAFNSYKETEELIKSTATDQQVHIRHNSPLFFVHPDGKDKARYRVELDEEGWLCIGSGKVLRDSEITKLIKDHPEQISSSALLRPLVQNTLFPNNILIGGQAELNYLGQLENLYDFLGVKRSVEQLLRISYCDVDEKTSKLLLELDLTLEDFAEDLNKAKNSLLSKSKQAKDAQDFKIKFENDLNLLLAELEKKVLLADKTLVSPLEKTKTNIKNSTAVLFEKYEKAALSKDQVSLDRLARAQNYLFPNGKAQERVVAGVYFLAKYGRSYLKQLS